MRRELLAYARCALKLNNYEHIPGTQTLEQSLYDSSNHDGNPNPLINKDDISVQVEVVICPSKNSLKEAEEEEVKVPESKRKSSENVIHNSQPVYKRPIQPQIKHIENE